MDVLVETAASTLSSRVQQTTWHDILKNNLHCSYLSLA